MCQCGHGCLTTFLLLLPWGAVAVRTLAVRWLLCAGPLPPLLSPKVANRAKISDWRLSAFAPGCRRSRRRSTSCPCASGCTSLTCWSAISWRWPALTGAPICAWCKTPRKTSPARSGGCAVLRNYTSRLHNIATPLTLVEMRSTSHHAPPTLGELPQVPVPGMAALPALDLFASRADGACAAHHSVGHASSDMLRQRTRCSKCGHRGDVTVQCPGWGGTLARLAPFPVPTHDNAVRVTGSPLQNR